MDGQTDTTDCSSLPSNPKSKATDHREWKQGASCFVFSVGICLRRDEIDFSVDERI